MESEQSQNFNERLSQWVANQGFWFQIRYSMTGSGNKGTAIFHLLSMGAKLLVFLLLVGAGSWIYLIKRADRPKFAAGLKDSIHSALSASETELDGVSRARGWLDIGRLVSQGGGGTFFTSMEVRNIRCKMGLLDGVTGKWETGPVSMATLDLGLRSGADDVDSAKAFSAALFRQSDKVVVNTLEVGTATLRWGYSERTRGSIEGSSLTVNRVGSGWRLSFKGGTFSQNWLRKLEIVNLVVQCDPDGMSFEKAEFRRGQGTVNLSGLKLTGGERPIVSGTAKIRMLGLDSALPPALRSFVEGSISGDFTVSGSTNSPEGIGFEGRVTLDGQDTISLRERIHLLKALSVVDYVRNYYRVDFREGAFQLKTGNGGLQISGLKLKAQDLLTLEGDLLVRMPTAEETKEAAGKIPGADSAPLFQSEKEPGDEIPAKDPDDGFTLNNAGRAATREKEPESSASLFNRLGLSLDERRLEQQAADRLAQTLRYSGSFTITLLPDAFERAPKLMQRFPVDTRLGRIPIVVPLEGTIYQLTLRQAEDIYQQRTR